MSLAGLRIGDDGKIRVGSVAKTLNEAALVAERITAELRRRNVHPRLMQYCDRELLQKDLFHGVHEGTKSIFERLRLGTGEQGDGGDLIDICFADNKGLPIVAINNYETESERVSEKGVD